MIAALIPAMLLQAAPAAPAPGRVAPPPPSAWPTLPALPFLATPVLTPDMMRFVRTEAEAGRCAATTRVGAALQVEVQVLVLTAGGARIRRVTPVAIHCPAVEQFTAGLVTGLARDNLDAGLAGGWYRTSITYSWTP